VITHSHKDVKEQLRVASLHFHLQSAAAFEGTAPANDEGKVVSAEARIARRRVAVGEAHCAEPSRSPILAPDLACAKPDAADRAIANGELHSR